MKPFISWLIDSELPRIVAFLGFLGDSLILLLGVVADFASGIIDRIQNILNFLTNVFEGNWKAIWDDIVNYIASPLAKKMNEAGYPEMTIGGFSKMLKTKSIKFTKVQEILDFLGYGLKVVEKPVQNSSKR